MTTRIAPALLLLLTLAAPAFTQDELPGDAALREMLGPQTPPQMRLWEDGDLPEAMTDAPAEVIDSGVRYRNVSVPTITVYRPTPETNTGRAIVICPGGGYGGLDWRTHVVYAADVFVPMGVTVIGLKYRLRPPHRVDNAGIQRITLLDAKRAIRTVRHHADAWGIREVGIAGYSAGANLAMNLAANFDNGDPDAADPVERYSSRPDFAVGMATWHWRQKQSPFTFTTDTPPVFLLHATNDGVPGGAPIELPKEIEVDLKELGVPVKFAVFDVGGHGVGNLIPQRVAHDFPPARWPQLLIEWLDSLPEETVTR